MAGPNGKAKTTAKAQSTLESWKVGGQGRVARVARGDGQVLRHRRRSMAGGAREGQGQATPQAPGVVYSALALAWRLSRCIM